MDDLRHQASGAGRVNQRTPNDSVTGANPMKPMACRVSRANMAPPISRTYGLTEIERGIIDGDGAVMINLTCCIAVTAANPKPR
jgi:hypothetical protein